MEKWIFTVLVLAAANWPFAAGASWRLGRRLAAWLAMYVLAVGAGCAMETDAGAVYPKDAVFFAVTFLLFAVLSFPGVVWRYVRPHRLS